ncbi:MAG TPA: transporter substrate-binding domain-containing protein [Bacteroidales bacterium]|nr:transporter substrate-binding domain-containing protein [Bacteroidales bacterium]
MSCNRDIPNKVISQTSFLDLDDFRTRGKLVAVTDFNSTNYFIYKGTPMGFHYELLKSFAEYSGLNLEIVTENDVNKSVELLNAGKADLLAVDLSVNSLLERQVGVTSSTGRSRQVLIQRKPNRWNTMSPKDLDKSIVRSRSALAGKTVYIQSGSSAAECLRQLNTQPGGKITVIEVPFETEDLVSLVAKREIDFAVCDESIALVNTGYYPVIDSKTVMSDEHSLAWGVRRQKSEKLTALFNNWLESYKSTENYSLLYSKYFRNSWSNHIIKSDYYTLTTGKVSPWDMYIKSFSDTINWDWRLLTSLIYQESRFDPDVVSFAGAYGLMQVLPATGRTFGVDIKASPVNNIKGGVRYLRYLQDFFADRIPDEKERIKFILAAYNCGEGNIIDAMKLAEKHGKNPLLWDNNVAYYLLKKTDPSYYNDPVVRNGYCRGNEPVNFVSEILQRYSEYKYIIPSGKDRPW